jgi:hypothetical protein
VQSLINSLFRGRALVAAFAVYGATIGTAAALGPLVGSALSSGSAGHRYS